MIPQWKPINRLLLESTHVYVIIIWANERPLFVMIMDVLACGITDQLPWCMRYAHGIVLCGTRKEEVETKLEEWRRVMEDRGLKIIRKKSVYLRCNRNVKLDGNLYINLQGDNLERVRHLNI